MDQIVNWVLENWGKIAGGIVVFCAVAKSLADYFKSNEAKWDDKLGDALYWVVGLFNSIISIVKVKK